jgi:hypothetical protein
LEAAPLLLMVKSLRDEPLSVTLTFPVGQGMVLMGGMVPLLTFAEHAVPEALVTSTRMI